MKDGKIRIKLFLLLFIIFFIPLLAMAKYCIYCGTKNQDDAVYCIKCGKNIPDADQNAKTGAAQSVELVLSESDMNLYNERAKGYTFFSGFYYIKSKGKFIISDITDIINPRFKDVQKGDQILNAGNTQTEGLEAIQLNLLLTKSEGTKVLVKLFREKEGKNIDLELTSQKEKFSGLSLIKDTGKIQVWRLICINDETPASFVEMLKGADSKGIREIVIDLRCCESYNKIEPVVNMLSSILPKGEMIGKAVYADGKKEKFINKVMPVTFLPITLIIDETVSGSAEFFAASLFENNRVKLIGNKTAGKPFIAGWKKDDKTFRSFIQATLFPADKDVVLGMDANSVRTVPENVEPVKWTDWYISVSEQKTPQK